MRMRWLYWLLAAAFVWLVVSRFSEVQTLAHTLAQGQWEWVLAAAALQVLYYLLFTGIYQAAFYTVEVQSRLMDLLPVTFASLFVNIAAPSGGASGTALFMNNATKRGQSPARTAAGVLLMQIADFAAFTPVLILGLVVLFAVHDLQIYEIISAILLLLLIGGLSAILLLGLWQPEALRKLLAWVQRTGNHIAGWVRRPAFLNDGWAEKTSTEFIESSLAIAAHPDRLGRTFLIAFLAHVADMASLYTLFLAFQQPIGVGVLVAGYAMGILFWIVSITPQGIGVVEGMMTLIFSSLGVPATEAAIITLAFRGMTFWLPLGIGFIALRRLSGFGAERRTTVGEFGVRLSALLTGAMGVINLLSTLTPALQSRAAILARFSPLVVRHGSHLITALAGFALIVLAQSLWRRKRMALLITLLVLILSMVSHLVKGLDYEEALLAGALATWLFAMRHHFHARSDAPSVRQGLTLLVASLVFTLVYGTAGFMLLDRHFRISANLGTAMSQTINLFLNYSNPAIQPMTNFGRYFVGSIYAVGIFTLGIALLYMIRPVIMRQPASQGERGRASSIVQAWGCSSLARITLLDDKLYWFSPGGSVIAYTVQGRVALTLGDPIGPPEDAAACLEAFQSFCATNDWEPSFYQVLPDRLETYHSAGFQSVCIGKEAIVDLAGWTLEGRGAKGLRSAENRLKRLGYQAEVYSPPFSANMLVELRQVSDDWLTMVHGSEKRFSLGWFDENYICSAPVIVLRNPGGSIEAFANILPEYRCNETTIDLMRYRPGGEHGLMDTLFVELLQWAKGQGYATFSLGLSALSGIGEKPEDPAVERALHYIFEHVQWFYNYKGLHAYKEKFHPTWSPRYIIYPGVSSLPAVALALIRADSGENWLEAFLRR